ncbi:MAG: spore germination protein [Ruminococcaceae bacterium]|nr:spore germination protein [Oscillospiraceae bacterium]
MSGGVNDYKDTYLSGNIDMDIALFKSIFSRDAVLRTREVLIGENVRCCLVFMDGMVNSAQLGETVVEALLETVLPQDTAIDCDYIAKNVLFANEVSETKALPDMLRAILYGDTLLIKNGSQSALTINTKGWRARGIKEPDSERVLQGPREGFDEAAMFNLAMIRRKLLTPDLCIEMMRIGRRSDTLVFVCYLGSLADKDMLKELKQRLKKIDIDGILDSNYIAENIRDSKYSLFKTMGSTERPDIVASRLLEGRIAVVVDGTPVVLTIPYLFSENFQSDEDYYINFTLASLARVLRWLCFFITVSVPGVFVALITHHFELLPTHFALTVARLRAGVPIASVVECIALVLAFEILKEAGLRMPQNLGHALSVVGGLVVGQAAVEAGIISAPILIAVAFSAIAGLMVPRLTGAVFYWRLFIVISCALLGIYGYLAAVSLFAIRVFDIKSFGVDYTETVRNPNFQTLKDTFIRAPWQFMKTRPAFNKNKTRKGG